MASTRSDPRAGPDLSPQQPEELAAATATGCNRRLAAMLAQFANSVYKPYTGELAEFGFGQDLGALVRQGSLDARFRDFVLMSTFRAVSGAGAHRSATLFGLCCLRLSPLEQSLLELAAPGGLVGAGLQRLQRAAGLPDPDLRRNHVKSLLRRPRFACRREVVVAFRGTQSGHDWLTDLVSQRTRNPYGDGQVHAGFLAAWESCRLTVRDAVQALVGDEEGGWLDHRAGRPLRQMFGDAAGGLASEATAALQRHTALYVTGHSLGGALATLCAADLSRDLEPVVYSFGSPRVGSRDFAAWFDRTIACRYSDAAQSLRSWRVHRPRDIVTMVPDALRYRHVGNAWSLGSYLLDDRMLGADIGKPPLPGRGLAAAVGHDMADYSVLAMYRAGSG